MAFCTHWRAPEAKHSVWPGISLCSHVLQSGGVQFEVSVSDKAECTIAVQALSQSSNHVGKDKVIEWWI